MCRGLGWSWGWCVCGGGTTQPPPVIAVTPRMTSTQFDLKETPPPPCVVANHHHDNHKCQEKNKPNTSSVRVHVLNPSNQANFVIYLKIFYLPQTLTECRTQKNDLKLHDMFPQK